MVKRYRVTLETAEREELQALRRSGTVVARKVLLQAQALLLLDRGPEGPGWTVARTATAVGVSTRTLERLKRRFVEEGLEVALRRKPRPRKPRASKFDGAFEARLIALACSKPPAGRRRWTLRLLAEQVVELDLTPSVSPMTVHRILKKTNSSPISRNIGGSRPRATPRSSPTWKMSSTSTSVRTTPSVL